MQVCQYCGSDYTPKGHRAVSKYCSRRCSAFGGAKAKGYGGTVKRACGTCGKEFNCFASVDSKHCSKECYTVAQTKPRPNCEQCGKTTRTMHNRFCSNECAIIAGQTGRRRTGVNSWVGFYSRAQAANPDKMPCIICGKDGQHRHHPDYGEPEFTVWLCVSCHFKLHRECKAKSGTNDRPDKAPVLE